MARSPAFPGKSPAREAPGMSPPTIRPGKEAPLQGTVAQQGKGGPKPQVNGEEVIDLEYAHADTEARPRGGRRGRRGGRGAAGAWWVRCGRWPCVWGMREEGRVVKETGEVKCVAGMGQDTGTRHEGRFKGTF